MADPLTLDFPLHIYFDCWNFKKNAYMLNLLQCINKGQSKLQELQVHESIKNKTQLWEVN